LLDANRTWEQFREIIRDKYYASEGNLRKAGGAAGNMWRFIHEMNEGDLIVVPYRSEFYVAEVKGSATYDPDKIDDTSYRRPVEWLNNKKPIRRNIAKSALVSRMKYHGTCARASDLLNDIEECLDIASSGHDPTFQADLQKRLIDATLDELRNGHMDDRRFEELIQTVLKVLGSYDTDIIPRRQDKGADIIATFRVAGAFSLKVAVQAKHWQPEPPVDAKVIEQLIRGIEAESVDWGMVITSGTISEEATIAAEKYYEDKGTRIELVDGEQFAKLIVENGILTS